MEHASNARTQRVEAGGLGVKVVLGYMVSSRMSVSSKILEDDTGGIKVQAESKWTQQRSPGC